MDLKIKTMIDMLQESIRHTDVSGFEILEILDVRSQLASREPLMNDLERARLEKLDRQMPYLADVCNARIAEVADISEMRRRSHVLPSHWWWYLDEWPVPAQKAALA
jgi:hypothetical protein